MLKKIEYLPLFLRVSVIFFFFILMRGLRRLSSNLDPSLSTLNDNGDNGVRAWNRGWDGYVHGLRSRVQVHGLMSRIQSHTTAILVFSQRACFSIFSGSIIIIME